MRRGNLCGAGGAVLWLIGTEGDFPDLQSALDAASDGDVLLLDLDVTGPHQVPADLTIRSVSGVHTWSTGGAGGGELLRVDDVAVTVVGLTLDGEAAMRVARVTDAAGSLTLDRVTLRDGSSSDDGGCVRVEHGALTMSGSTAEGCASYGRGGAVAVDDGALVVSDCDFVGNFGTTGGAVWTDVGGVVERSRFRDNVAIDGGAVAVTGGSTTLVGDHFCGNAAIEDGGAVYAEAPIDELVQCVFWLNSGTTSGAIRAAEIDVAWGLDFLSNAADLGASAAVSDPDSALLDVISVDHLIGPFQFDGALPAPWLSSGNAVSSGSGVAQPIVGDPAFLVPAYPAVGCDTRGLQLGATSSALGVGESLFSDDLGAYPCGAVDLPGDGIDNDCDGDDACFADIDGDGFGTSDVMESPSAGCDDPGESEQDTDCDDADPVVYPDAIDLPEGKDGNCDGYDRCWVDADGDGFTTDRQYVALAGSCPPNLGHDCDDGDPSIHPDATEIGGDAIDQDCDGVDPPCAPTDADGDGHFTGCGIDDDCDDTDPSVYVGAPEPCGLDLDCDGAVTDCPPGDTGDTAEPGPETGVVDSGAPPASDSGAAPPPWIAVGLSGGNCGCRTAAPPTWGLLVLVAAASIRRRAR